MAQFEVGKDVYKEMTGAQITTRQYKPDMDKYTPQETGYFPTERGALAKLDQKGMIKGLADRFGMTKDEVAKAIAEGWQKMRNDGKETKSAASLGNLTPEQRIAQQMEAKQNH